MLVVTTREGRQDAVTTGLRRDNTTIPEFRLFPARGFTGLVGNFLLQSRILAVDGDAYSWMTWGCHYDYEQQPMASGPLEFSGLTGNPIIT